MDNLSHLLWSIPGIVALGILTLTSTSWLLKHQKAKTLLTRDTIIASALTCLYGDNKQRKIRCLHCSLRDLCSDCAVEKENNTK